MHDEPFSRQANELEDVASESGPVRVPLEFTAIGSSTAEQSLCLICARTGST